MTDSERHTVAGISPDRTRWLIYAASAIILVFIVAMLWQLLQTRRVQGELSRTQQALQVTELEATLAAAAIEAERGSFEVARQLASNFFSGLQTAAGNLPADLRSSLTAILAQRDATITLLSRGDPQSANVLARMHAQYRTTVRGPDPTAPIAAPIGPAPAQTPAPDATPASPPETTPAVRPETTPAAPPPGS